MLLSVHHNLSAQWGEWLGCTLPQHYGDLDAEYTALTRGAGVIDLSGWGKLRLTGDDRIRYLQGQLSQDMLPLQQAGKVAYSCLLKPTGQMLSDMVVFSSQHEVFVVTPPQCRQVVYSRLEQFVVMEDVEVEDLTEAYALLHMAGAQAKGVVRTLFGIEAPPTCSATEAQWRSMPVTIVGVNRCGEQGFDLFLQRELAEELWQTMTEVGATPVGFSAFDIRRVEAGIPLFGVDMDENTIPLEAGLGERAICHTKGCYTGQEVIHRIISRGHTNRSLVGLRISGEQIPPKRTPLHVEGAGEVGWVTSAVRSIALQQVIGLGYVRNQYAAVGTCVKVGQELPSEAVVASLPFVEGAGD